MYSGEDNSAIIWDLDSGLATPQTTTLTFSTPSQEPCSSPQPENCGLLLPTLTQSVCTASIISYTTSLRSEYTWPDQANNYVFTLLLWISRIEYPILYKACALNDLHCDCSIYQIVIILFQTSLPTVQWYVHGWSSGQHAVCVEDKRWEDRN